MNTDISFLLLSLVSFFWAGWTAFRVDAPVQRTGINITSMVEKASWEQEAADNTEEQIRIVVQALQRNSRQGLPG